MDLGDFRLAAGGGKGAGAGDSGQPQGAAAGEGARGRVWGCGFSWVMLGHSDASAAQVAAGQGGGTGDRSGDGDRWASARLAGGSCFYFITGGAGGC